MIDLYKQKKDLSRQRRKAKTAIKNAIRENLTKIIKAKSKSKKHKSKRQDNLVAIQRKILREQLKKKPVKFEL